MWLVNIILCDRSAEVLLWILDWINLMGILINSSLYRIFEIIILISNKKIMTSLIHIIKHQQ